MLKFLTSSKSTVLLLLVIAFALLIGLLQAASIDSSDSEDISADEELKNQRREEDFKQLRQFLLTSNAEQRAAKREKQDFYKRELVREYFRSLDDPNRLQELKKRIKTFCNSYEDVINSDRAACG